MFVSDALISVTVCLLCQSRELEVGVFCRDRRAMCAVRFLRLEEMMDNPDHSREFSLQPQGILHAKVHAKTCLGSVENLFDTTKC